MSVPALEATQVKESIPRSAQSRMSISSKHIVRQDAGEAPRNRSRVQSSCCLACTKCACMYIFTSWAPSVSWKVWLRLCSLRRLTKQKTARKNTARSLHYGRIGAIYFFYGARYLTAAHTRSGLYIAFLLYFFFFFMLSRCCSCAGSKASRSREQS